MIERKVLTFNEIGRVNIAEGRTLVVSKVNETGNISIAQLLTRQNRDTGETEQYFPKHSTTILNEDTLKDYIKVLQSIGNKSVKPTANKKSKGVI